MHTHSTVEVLTAALRDSAAAMRDAGEHVGSLGNWADLECEVGRALPGSASAHVVPEVVEQWTSRLTRWSESALDFARKVEQCADTYDEHERHVHDTFARIGHEPRGGE
ncbi:hypothetical protein [Actinosynnema sp. NPDC020468]|uniref:hypothetical protein n=1 Tax=Actinosynnema sp. NPDC020468 TaxID=3154488 RepID=UPI0033E3ADBF